MATIRDHSQGSIPSAPIVPATGFAAEAQVASAEAQQFEEQGRMAGQIGQIATGVMRDEALRRAQEDAAQIVQYDKDNKLITPKSFDAPGFSGLVYGDTYRKAALEYYRSAALTEGQSKASELLAANPTNPGAVSAGMRAYFDEKLKIMPPAVAQTMVPHFEAVISGATTSAQSAAQRQNLEVMRDQAQRATEGYTSRYAAAVADLDGRKVPADQRAATLAKYEDEWKMVEAQLRGAGYTDQHIANVRKSSEVFAEAKVIGRGLYTLGAQSHMAPGMTIEAEKRIRAFVDKHPEYGKESEAVLRGEFSRGQNIANAVGQAEAIEQQKVQGDIIIDGLNLKRWIDKNGKDFPVVADSKRQDFYESVQQRVAGLRPLQRAQILASAYDTGNTLVQQAYGSAVTQAVQIATTSANPLQRQLAVNDLQGFVDNPAVANQAGNMQSYVGLARRVIAGHRMETMAADAGQLETTMRAGSIDPASMSTVFEGLKDRGMVGPAGAAPVSFERFAALVAENNKAWNTNQNNRMAAAGAIERSLPNDSGRTPVFPSEKDSKNIQATLPFQMTAKGVDGMQRPVPWNIDNPDHVRAAGDYFVRNRVLPEEVKDSLDKIKPYDPVERKQVGLQIAERVRNEIRTALKGNTRGGEGTLSDRFLDDLVYSNLEGALGSSYGKLMAWSAYGPEATPKETAASTAMQTPGRNQGDATSGDKMDIAARLVGLSRDAYENSGMITRAANSVFRATTGWMMGPDTKLRYGAFRNEESRVLLQGLVGPSGLEGDSPDAEKTTWSPAALDAFAQNVNAYVRKNGDMDRQNGKDPVDIGIMKAMRDLTERGMIGLRRTQDGGHQIELRPAVSEFNSKNGTAWNAEDVANFYTAKVQGEAPQRLSNVDLQTVRVLSRINPDGTATHYLSGLDKDHKTPIYISPVSITGKDIDQQRVQLGNAIAEEMGSGIAQLFSRVPGGDMIRAAIAGNKRETLLALASGKALPSEEWTSFVRTLRQSYTPFFGVRVADADWDKLEKVQAQETIARYGSAFYLLFGNEGTDYLAFSRKGPASLDKSGSPIDVQGEDAFNTRMMIEAEASREVREALAAATKARAMNRKPPSN